MYRQSIQFPVKDTALREDVHALGDLIGETLRDQGGEEFFKLVEGDRLAAIRAPRGRCRRRGRTGKRAPTGRSPSAATDLTRAFSIWFQAVNTAEKVHRVRRRRQYLERFEHRAARRHRGLHRAPAARRRVARSGAGVDRLHEHRAGVHGASHRIDAPHDPAQAAAHRAGLARPPNPALDARPSSTRCGRACGSRSPASGRPRSIRARA